MYASPLSSCTVLPPGGESTETCLLISGCADGGTDFGIPALFKAEGATPLDTCCADASTTIFVGNSKEREVSLGGILCNGEITGRCGVCDSPLGGDLCGCDIKFPCEGDGYLR